MPDDLNDQGQLDLGLYLQRNLARSSIRDALERRLSASDAPVVPGPDYVCGVLPDGSVVAEGTSANKPFVAKLTGLGGKFGVERVFLGRRRQLGDGIIQIVVPGYELQPGTLLEIRYGASIGEDANQYRRGYYLYDRSSGPATLIAISASVAMRALASLVQRPEAKTSIVIVDDPSTVESRTRDIELEEDDHG